MFAIQFKNVSKIYNLYESQKDQFINLLGLQRFGIKPKTKPKKFVALNEISLDIKYGERIGIIGRNGSGKTTLLKLITRNFSPTYGTLEINGSVQALMSVGLGFHPDFTGRENIVSSLQYSGLEKNDYEYAIQDIIEFCELGNFLDQPFKTYSLGMQARLQFACATALKPEVLIIDEVLGAGDAYFSAKSNNRMNNIIKSGCTLLLVSHSMSQILQFCDIVVWLDSGKIKKIGNAREIVTEYEAYMLKPLEKNNNNAGIAVKLFNSEKLLLNSALNKNCEKETEEAIDVLADGKKVYRWSSEKGIKLNAIDIHVNNKINYYFNSGSNIDFVCYLKFEIQGDLSFYYQISIFSLNNTRICSLLSPLQHAKKVLIGEIRSYIAKLSPCLLKAGNYYINFVILHDNGLKTLQFNRRYDLVSRFCDFEIYSLGDYREQPIFDHPVKWIS